MNRWKTRDDRHRSPRLRDAVGERNGEEEGRASGFSMMAKRHLHWHFIRIEKRQMAWRVTTWRGMQNAICLGELQRGIEIANTYGDLLRAFLSLPKMPVPLACYIVLRRHCLWRFKRLFLFWELY